MIKENIQKVAFSYVGQKETDGNSGFLNPDFQKKMETMGWERGEPWCASFAKLIFSEAYINDPILLAEIEKLFSKSAVQTYKNFDRSDWKTQNPNGSPITIPQVGALAVWRMGDTAAGHIGVVVNVISDTEFESVEGNTNSMGGREGVEVAVKKRSSIRTNRMYSLNFLGFVLPKPVSEKPKDKPLVAEKGAEKEKDKAQEPVAPSN